MWFCDLGETGEILKGDGGNPARCFASQSDE